MGDGDRKLSSIRELSQPLQDTCIKSSFRTVKDVLSRTRGELVQVLDMTTSDVDDLMDTVCKHACPKPKSVMALMENKRANGGGFLSTGLPDLDGGCGKHHHQHQHHHHHHHQQQIASEPLSLGLKHHHSHICLCVLHRTFPDFVFFHTVRLRKPCTYHFPSTSTLPLPLPLPLTLSLPRSTMLLRAGVLLGGLPHGGITELVGAAGAGKTQFCLQSCVMALQDPDHSAVYIDTV